MIRPANEGIDVWLSVEPVDFRKQITGLATLVQDTLAMDPFSTQLFVFTNRRRTQCRILYWERLCTVAKAPRACALRLAAPHRCGGEPERGAIAVGTLVIRFSVRLIRFATGLRPN